MKNTRTTTYLFTLLILFSCNNKQETKAPDLTLDSNTLSREEVAEEDLYMKVMAIHDSIMPATGTMMSIKGKLQQKLTQAKGGTEPHQPTLEALESAIKELEQADDAMFDWMNKFIDQDTVENHDQVMRYYSIQKEEIEDIRDMMEKAVRNGNNLL